MNKHHIVTLFTLGSLLVSCTGPHIAILPVSPLSPVQTSVPAVVTATAISSPMPTVPAPHPTATLSSTRTPLPTPVPTLARSALSPEAIAAMAVWKKANSVTGYALYQISETPLGVVDLQWSPDGRSLWLNVAAGPGGMGNLAPTTSLVINRDSHKGWPAGGWGDTRWGDIFCSTAHDWSPDGRQLAYIKDGQLWLAEAEGRNPRPQPLPSGAEGFGSPRYSADGRMIAVLGSRIVGNSVHYDVWGLDIATGSFKRIIEDAGYNRPIWAPSGSKLAHLGLVYPADTARYPRGVERLWISDALADRTTQADLVPPAGGEGCISPPTWLMGGKKVLVTLLHTPGVWIVDLDGNVERLDQGPNKQSGRPSGLAAPSTGGACGSAFASPDGRYVVFTSGSTKMHVTDLQTGNDLDLGPGGDLWCYGMLAIGWAPQKPQFLRWGQTLPLELVDATTGNVRRLASSGLWPAWSPDGRHVAYWQSEAQGYALWLLNLDDLKSVRLTSPSRDDPREWSSTMPFFYDVMPHWSPDGTSIAFVSFRGEHPEAYLVQLSGKGGE